MTVLYEFFLEDDVVDIATMHSILKNYTTNICELTNPDHSSRMKKLSLPASKEEIYALTCWLGGADQDC